MTDQLSKEALDLINKYTNGAGLGDGTTAQHQNFELSQNGRNRMQETLRSTGMDRESPEAYKIATARALAEQRGQMPMNEGVNGRNGLGSSTRSIIVGRSLSDIANGPKEVE